MFARLPSWRNIQRRNSSKAWLQRHVKDVFVKQSKSDNLRSRSAYKLVEIQEKHKLIRPGDYVLDLGAAPGGWSIVAAKTLDVTKNGLLVSVDILGMEPVGNFPFIQGDMTTVSVQDSIKMVAKGREANVVLSDMMANTTGNKTTDHFRSMHLCSIALDMCRTHLASDGSFLCKFFRGADEREFINEARQIFRSVKIVKPKASRAESAEIYLLANGKY